MLSLAGGDMIPLQHDQAERSFYEGSNIESTVDWIVKLILSYHHKEKKMKKLQSPLFRGMLVVVLALTVLAGSIRTVYADSGAFTWQNVTDTFVAFGSCSDPDDVYQITIVSSGAIHFVENANGYKFSWAENGTYYIEPIDAASPVTYSGRYSTHLADTGIFSDGKFVFKNTFTNVGRGSDGTRETFHFTNIFAVTPTGIENERESVQWICN